MDTEKPKRINILIVDDQAILLRTLKRVLMTRFGTAIVVCCGSAEEGLAAMTTETALLITDYEMPGMSGADLIPLARERAPRIRVILMSGNETKLADFRAIHPETPTLDKPCSASSFLAAVARELDAT